MGVLAVRVFIHSCPGDTQAQQVRSWQCFFSSLSHNNQGEGWRKKKKTNPDVIHGVVTDLAVVTRVGTTSPESHTCWTTPVGLICMHEWHRRVGMRKR